MFPEMEIAFQKLDFLDSRTLGNSVSLVIYIVSIRKKMILVSGLIK